MTRSTSPGDVSDLVWFKSSYSSSSEGDSCVEVAWRKSSYSGGPDGDTCVEVAATPAAVHVRDSKVADGPLLVLSPEAWRGFVGFTGTHS
ncbi:DUF397 domain-containing protein [Streptomyces sp. NRRL F-5727]|uniref:DUF397 domain-containing protein n=1 Tax=Streptomyces sp. NRRL F-5727 TaxID=1463871 RepID=UPI0004C8C744|nr:DUF397 domain-containing protein [Streptomyces sp. NRRL F-5727]